MSTSDVGTVRENLHNIIGLTAALADQATLGCNHGKLIGAEWRDVGPGGNATNYLGPVANHEAHMNLRMSAIMGRKPDWEDRRGETHFDDETDTFHPLHFLAKWEAEWRDQLDQPSDLRPTIGRAFDYLNRNLSHMSEHSEAFDDFAAELRAVKHTLEETLHAGTRHERGVPCIRCDNAVDLVRFSDDPRDNPLDQGGLRDEWVCPACRTTYDRESYYRAVHHAHFAHADYLSLSEAAERTGARESTIKVWATRGHVGKRKDPNTGRMTYRVEDIETRRSADEVA